MHKQPEPESETLRLSPLSRLYLTLDNEFQLDTSFVTDEARYKRFLEMFRLSEQKRDTLLRNFLILDAVALLLLFGKSINIPGINITLSEIPAAREILIFFSAFIFQFAAAAFLNWNGYAAIIDTINLHRSRKTGTDPDYLSASDKFFEFVVKLYRPKMNIYGPDLVVPGRAYRIMSRFVLLLTVTTMLSLLCLHLIIAGVSVRQTISTIEGGVLNLILLYSYVVFVCAANLGGVLIFFTSGRQFRFTLPDTAPKT